ncbi:type II secretion system protein GspM [Novosphingobium sp. SL115]|uniref:type II secretion system protein GspM n=1 Tax=Novosphingobium sp. SL115 TaxID=2995150 RepID=UPI002274EA90|nr:type II secretion system protein GspM [Novosphingobium sp. SL115]MCY1669703.1 type II secretion system protein GspM [Novosphingobium sp. SL115]
MGQLGTWFGGLTGREKALVGIACGITALVVLVYGIILPLGSALDEAATRHRIATERAGRIAAQVRILKTAPPAPKAALGGPVEQVAGASAQEAGFVVQSNQRRGSDMAALIIPTARPSAALAWLDGLATQGLAVEQLTMTPAPDGSVSINVTLRRSGS